MINSATDSADAPDPSRAPLTPNQQEAAAQLQTAISTVTWDRVEGLFDRMVESDDPWAVLAQETDPAAAHAAERLYRAHLDANSRGFLDATITLVHDLRESNRGGPPRFSAGQALAGRFIIESLLGVGGMGEVYSARDERLGERVAIKTIRSYLTGDSSIRRRFVGEIQSARRVTHRNVCRIFDLFEHGDTPFFSMEFLDGGSLSQWLRQDRPLAVRRRVALGAC
jgi:hypothetical protein